MDIVDATSVLQNVYQITSLSQWYLNRKTWSFERARLLEMYTFIISLASSAFLLYSIFTNDDFIKTSDNDIGQTVDFIQMIGIRLAHIVSITESLFKKKKQRQFFESTKQIDRLFECAFNINMDNRQFRNAIIRRGIVMLSIYMISEIFILASKSIITRDNFFLFWIFYLMPMLICGLRYFQIFTYVTIVKKRLDKIVEILVEINLVKNSNEPIPDCLLMPAINLLSKQSTIGNTSPSVAAATAVTNTAIAPVTQPNRCTKEAAVKTTNRTTIMRRNYCNVTESNEIKKIFIIRDIYGRLYELTNQINGYFGVSMLINIGNDFISITSNCYWIFISFKEFTSSTTYILQIACSAVWSIPHILNILVLANICEQTVKSTTNIALALHHIQMDISNVNHNSMITQFSLQLLHSKLSLTAAGFFHVDCNLLYTIIGATTTYLIILIQFHLNEVKPNSEVIQTIQPTDDP